ncbi:MAG: substrate-binding domain-containing protein [Phormidesmis sp.]
MVSRKTASAFTPALTIAALLACTTPTRSVATYLVTPLIGQAAPSFPVPDAVAKGTKISVASSSNNMNAVSQTLAKGFKNQYSGTVEVTSTDVNTAIQDVLNGNTDLAAISRPLSAEEKAKGLIAVPVRREKIAIVVSKDNPFAASLTSDQFARIFRGEIKDWSAVGDSAGPIKVVDRPAASETRQALKTYPVFASSEFKTGSNATQLSEDSAEALAKAVGKDGIGYALVSQLEGQPGIKAIELHKTLPDNPLYPFSQPYSFVYAGGASPAVAAFLGYATGNPGQSALNGAGLSGYAVLPTAGTTAANRTDAGLNAGTAAGDGASSNAAAEGTAGNSTDGTADSSANGNAVGSGATEGTSSTVIVEEDDSAVLDGKDGLLGAEDGVSANRGRWWWLLLPLAGLGLLIWAASKRGTEEETGYIANGGAKGGSVDNDDDKVRGAYRSADSLPKAGPNAGSNGELNSVAAAEADGINSSVGMDADAGMGAVGVKPAGLGSGEIAAAGITGVAAATAGASAGLGRMRNTSGDTTIDSNIDSKSISGSVEDGIGSRKGSAFQSGSEDIQGDTREGLGNLRANVQGGVAGDRTNRQTNVQANRQDGSIDPIMNLANDNSVEEADSTWLDRAKARINEATEQVKDPASDVENDTSGKKL